MFDRRRRASQHGSMEASALMGARRLGDHLSSIEGPATEFDFIAADRFSIADITAVVAVDFARVVKVKPGEQHSQLQRWRAAMAQRPSMAL
jgi:glutathione S-transferase